MLNEADSMPRCGHPMTESSSVPVVATSGTHSHDRSPLHTNPPTSLSIEIRVPTEALPAYIDFTLDGYESSLGGDVSEHGAGWTGLPAEGKEQSRHQPRGDEDAKRA